MHEDRATGGTDNTVLFIFKYAQPAGNTEIVKGEPFYPTSNKSDSLF